MTKILSWHRPFFFLKKSSVIICSFVFLSFLCSCHRSEKIDPQIDYAIQDHYLLSLPSPFEPLTAEEKKEEWSREYRIGIGFAHELDLYQAITSFKRAEFLTPDEDKARKQEMQYEIFLCYYLGRKYEEAIYEFEKTDLHFVDGSFPAFQDLLILLYDCYNRVGDEKKADRILNYIQQYYPESAEKLYVYATIREGDTEKVREIAQHPSYEYLNEFLDLYEHNKKSIRTAKSLNAFLPGAGYFYLGQTQSGITAMLLNGLFIGATYYFFDHGNIPAGLIFTSFEAGWYFGGIYGAGEEAKFYNERAYERYATPVMNQHGLFPGFMIKYAF